MNMSDVTTMSAMFFGNSYVGIVCDAQDGRNILLVIVLLVCDTQVRSGLCVCLRFSLGDPKAQSQVEKQCKQIRSEDSKRVLRKYE